MHCLIDRDWQPAIPPTASRDSDKLPNFRFIQLLLFSYQLLLLFSYIIIIYYILLLYIYYYYYLLLLYIIIYYYTILLLYYYQYYSAKYYSVIRTIQLIINIRRLGVFSCLYSIKNAVGQDSQPFSMAINQKLWRVWRYDNTLNFVIQPNDVRELYFRGYDW